MVDKKYSHGKKEMSLEEFADMQTHPYKDARGRRFTSEELKSFSPPGGKLTYVGEGSSEYGGKESGAGRGQAAGPTTAQLKSINAGKKTPYKSISERLEMGRVAEEAEADRAAQKKQIENMRKGGKVSASSRADGCAIRGKTRGRIV